MSGGGTNTVQTQSAPNPTFTAAYDQAFARASQVSGAPYTAPQAPVAPLTSLQNAGIAGVANAQGAEIPYLNQAQNDINAVTGSNLAASYEPFQSAANKYYGSAAAEPIAATYSPYASEAKNYFQSAPGAYQPFGAAASALYNQSPGTFLQQGGSQAQSLYGQAPGTFTPYGGIASGLYNETTGPITPTQFSGQEVSKYESPYTKDVINATQAQFNNSNAQQQAQVSGNAISSGAWGSDRSAVAAALTAGQQDIAESPVIAGLYNQNYAQALGEFNTQQQVGVGAQEATAGLRQAAAQGITGIGAEQAGLQLQSAAGLAGVGATEAGLQQGAAAGLSNVGATGAGLELQAGQGIAGVGRDAANALAQQGQLQLGAGQGVAQTGATLLGANEAQAYLNSQAAYSEMGLGNQALNSQLTEANALYGTGSAEQGQIQAEMNAPYYQELARQAYPFQTSQFLTNAALGLGSQSGGSSSTTQPGPSWLSQVGGAGIAGLGTYGLLNSTGALSGLSGLFGGGAGASALAFAKSGGAIPHRASGGFMGGMPLSGIGPVNDVPAFGSGQPAGIAGVVSVQPGGGHGSGPPRPPSMPPQQNTLAQEMQQAAAMSSLGKMIGSPSVPGSGAARGGVIGLWSGGMHDSIDTRSLVPHPRVPGATGIASHAFHPPGLAMPHLGSGGIVAYPDQTSQEVNTLNSATAQGDAMAAAMAEMGAGQSQMMPQQYMTMARGGGIARYAGGGGVNDDAPIAITGADDDTTMPIPPIPPAGGPPPQSAPQNNGIAAADHHGAVDAGVSPKETPTPRDNSDIWTTVLAAGLGMMGGRSPYAGVNIGQGALEGLKMGEDIQNRHATQDLRMAQQADTASYRKQMADAATQRADTGANAVELRHQDRQDALAQGMTLAQMRMANAMARAASAEGKDHFSVAGTDPDTGNLLLLSGNTGKIVDSGRGVGLKPAEQAKADETNKKSAAGALNPETIDMLADDLNKGDTSVLTGLGMGSSGTANRTQVLNRAQEKLAAQGQGGADLAANKIGYFGERAGSRTADTRGAYVDMAVNEANKFAPLALNASEKVDRTQFPTLNAAMQAWQKGTGNEDVVRLGIATQSFANAYARAVTPVGQPTDAKQHQAMEMLDKYWSQGQYKTALDQLGLEMAAAKASPEQYRTEQQQRISGHEGAASPAGAPSAAAPVIPQRPAGVPEGSLYSPSRHAWRTPDGTIVPGGP